jgi:hypothetical protein
VSIWVGLNQRGNKYTRWRRRISSLTRSPGDTGQGSVCARRAGVQGPISSGQNGHRADAR